MYNQLGLCEIARGDYQKALEAFQAGMQVGNSAMMQTLSFNEIVAYEHLGDFKQAFVLMEILPLTNLSICLSPDSRTVLRYCCPTSL